jgi:hypothetical protein
VKVRAPPGGVLCPPRRHTAAHGSTLCRRDRCKLRPQRHIGRTHGKNYSARRWREGQQGQQPETGQALLGFTSEARWLPFGRAHLRALFPYLPG